MLLWVWDGFTLESRKRACGTRQERYQYRTRLIPSTGDRVCVCLCVPGCLHALCLCSEALGSVCVGALARRQREPAEGAGSSRTLASPGSLPCATERPSEREEGARGEMGGLGRINKDRTLKIQVTKGENQNKKRSKEDRQT